MREKLSIYKFKKIATESLKNGIRLHRDSILLYKNSSFATALQLSILAIEEIAKAHWVEHYYYTSITNNGFPEKDFEQQWLKQLYLHLKKQHAFFAKDSFDYSPEFLETIKIGNLENLKQKATYVGLAKNNRGINVNSRISSPNQIKQNDAKKYISIVNDTFFEIWKYNSYMHPFSIEEMNNLFGRELRILIHSWKYKSGIKRNRFFTKAYEKKQQLT